MITLTLLLPALSLATPCLPVEPYHRLGSLRIGAKTPSDFVPEKNATSWGRSGATRLEKNARNEIVILQRELNEGECLHVQGKTLPYGISAANARREFPACEFEARIGGDRLQCDGFSLAWSAQDSQPVFRVEVSADDLDSEHQARAKAGALEAIRKETR